MKWFNCRSKAKIDHYFISRTHHRVHCMCFSVIWSFHILNAEDVERAHSYLIQVLPYENFSRDIEAWLIVIDGFRFGQLLLLPKKKWLIPEAVYLFVMIPFFFASLRRLSFFWHYGSSQLVTLDVNLINQLWHLVF